MNNLAQLLLLILLAITTHCENYCGEYNCYELLGVDSQADQNTIKKAFRELAKKHHPDKNKEDTTALFQMINKAYEILTDEKSRFKYNLHLQNPEESEYYHQYRYYSQKYIQDPQIHPALVVSVLLALISLLQYVMRKQMYERAIESITEGHDFKTKVNQRCGNNKKLKQKVREEMIQQISIEGGYSKPQIKDILACKLLLFPYHLALLLNKKIRWFVKYTIKKQEYSKQDQETLTITALNLTPARWQNINQNQKESLLSKQLWLKQNLQNFQKQKKQQYLEQLKNQKPTQYQMYLKYLKKNQ